MHQIPPGVATRFGAKDAAAKQLQEVVNAYAKEGWEFYRVDQFEVIESIGCGCIAFIFRLVGWNQTETRHVYVLTFRQERSQAEPIAPPGEAALAEPAATAVREEVPTSSPVDTAQSPKALRLGVIAVAVSIFLVTFVLIPWFQKGSIPPLNWIRNGIANLRGNPEIRTVGSATPVVHTESYTARQPSDSDSPGVEGDPEPDDAQDDEFPGEHFPETRLRLISQAEIDFMNFAQARYAVNEAYARHGVTFRKGPIRDQFLKMSWYQPVAGRYFENSLHLLTETERVNVKLLEARLTYLKQSGQTN